MSYSDRKIVKNSIFLKVEQGQPHTIRLLDESPTEQWQHKINDKLMACAGDVCPYCEDGHSKNQRFVTNVFDHNDSKVLLWSYGATVAEALKTIAVGLEKDGEDILNHDLEVTVKGEAIQKKTSIQLRFKSLPIPEGLKRLRIGNAEPRTEAEDGISF